MVFDHAYRLYRLTDIGPRPVNHLDHNHHHIVIIIYDLVANMTHKFSLLYKVLLQPQTNFCFLQNLKLLTPPTPIPYDDNKFQRVSAVGFGRQKSSWNFH